MRGRPDRGEGPCNGEGGLHVRRRARPAGGARNTRTVAPDRAAPASGDGRARPGRIRDARDLGFNRAVSPSADGRARPRRVRNAPAWGRAGASRRCATGPWPPSSKLCQSLRKCGARSIAACRGTGGPRNPRARTRLPILHAFRRRARPAEADSGRPRPGCKQGGIPFRRRARPTGAGAERARLGGGRARPVAARRGNLSPVSSLRQWLRNIWARSLAPKRARPAGRARNTGTVASDRAASPSADGRARPGRVRNAPAVGGGRARPVAARRGHNTRSAPRVTARPGPEQTATVF